MNKRCAMSIAVLAVASTGLAVVQTNTFQYGGEGNDVNWTATSVTNNGVSPVEYSITQSLTEFPELSNVTFTVTFTETNGIPVYVGNQWIGAGAGDTALAVNKRITSNEVVRLSFSFSDPDNELLDLRLSGIGTMWNTKAWETLVFSDGTTHTNITYSSNDTILDYEALGLTPLNANNVDTWEMFVGADDTLGGGTNFTESGMGAFVLEYIADVTVVPPSPEYTPLTSAFFDFLEGGEFDAKGLGTTMTRSNGWDTAITITTIEIIGQDLTLASEGTGNKTNMKNTGAMGIDSVVSGGYSQESRDFNPNEGWVINFDVNVYLEDIDMASVSTDTVMTVSSSAFSDIVLLGLGDGNTAGTFDLLNTYVPAGTNVTFQMTSTTNASDVSLRIDDLTVQAVSDQESYQAWIQDENLSKDENDGYGDDPDGDTMDNLLEFALGGDPLVDDSETYLPEYAGLSEDGTTNYLNYVYRRRIRSDNSGLDYAVGSTVNLTAEPATNATEEAGAGAIDSLYESVTNRVSTETEDQQFMQLKVTID